MVAAAVADGQTAMAITDHGNCAGHPDFQLVCDEAGIKPIFGLEAYFVDDRTERSPEKRDYYHLVLWAMDDQGLKNLWAMSTESFKDGFYYKPRIDWDTLERLNEGVIASTACLRGPLAHPWLKGDTDLALSNMARLWQIFGDRLYAEIHVNHLPQQIEVNRWLEEVCDTYGIEPIAVVDSHYANCDDQHNHRVWLSVQTDSDAADDSSLFGGNQDYHLMTEAEVREKLLSYELVSEDEHSDDEPSLPIQMPYLPEDFTERAIANTVILADRCTARIAKKGHNPIYSKGAGSLEERVELDKDKLLELCMKEWPERLGGRKEQAVYMARFEEEISLIFAKGFSGYYLMVWDLVGWAKSQGILVGPGRGSGVGSLVAYVIGITEADPVVYDVLFARFMTKGRTELPDFDIDFPSSKKELLFDYMAKRWGANNVSNVSTHQRLKSKSAVQAVARALASTLPENFWSEVVLPVSKLVDDAEADTAGLGLSWEDLWAKAEEELEPYRKGHADFFELVGALHGRLKTYGKHPAGIIVDPDNELTTNLPLRSGEDGQMITQFDLKVLEILGYVKFDLLNLRTLDTLQKTIDLIEATTGRRIDPYAWRAELKDPYVYDQLAQGWTLGCFQIETTLGTKMCRDFKPATMADLADVITLVRPGPRNSGLTAAYLRRREGREEVTYADPRMEAILSGTEGAMIYQEQLMALCIELAGYDDVEADTVRKILGKKKVEAARKEKPRFIERAVANGTDRQVTEDLWDQLEEFARYSFGKGHAIGYALLVYWTAWFKSHYPLHLLCSALSTVDSDAIPAFVEEARRMGYQVLPPDVNQSGEGFALDGSGLAVRYGLDAVKGIGTAAARAVIQGQPYTTWEDFMERKEAKCNSGGVKTLAHIGAFDSLEPHRRWLEEKLELEGITSTDRCVHKSSENEDIIWLPTPPMGQPPEPEELEWRLPCNFAWIDEPSDVGRTGKAKKRKNPPKKCTRACRNYTPTMPPDPSEVARYTDEEIRNIEVEVLGVYLSSTPFSRIPEEDRENFATALDVLTGPNGDYPIAAVIKGFRTAKKRNDMGFLTFVTERGEMDCVVFPSTYEKYRYFFKTGSLVYATVTKNDRGQALNLFMPID